MASAAVPDPGVRGVLKSRAVRTVWYRVVQFLRALTARVSEQEVESAVSVLTPAAQELFRRQAIQDQRHALDVYHTLRQKGHTNSHLLAAALLHDAGKATARLPAWQRAVIVLLDRFAPRLLNRLSQRQPQGRTLPPSGPAAARGAQADGDSLPEAAAPGAAGWRRPFVVHARHAQVGARWAQEAGCSPSTVALIRRHHDALASDSPATTGSDAEEDRLLAALQTADSTN